MYRSALLAVLALLAGHTSACAGEASPGPPSEQAFVYRGGVSPINLPALTASSEFVWKGEIIAATDPVAVTVPYKDHELRVGARTLTFRIDLVLKGSPPEAHSGSFELYTTYGRGPLWSRLGGPFEAGWYGIVFLFAKEGRVVPTDPVYPGIQVSPLPARQIATEGRFALVEAELINTLRDSRRTVVQSAADLLLKLHRQVAVAREFGRPEDVVPLDTATTIAGFHELASSPDPILAGAGHAALLHLGDISRLPQAIAFVEEYGPPPGVDTKPHFQGTESTHYARCQILHAISELDDDAAAPLLNPLLASSDSWVRENVVAPLRRMADRASMPYFAALLDDPNLDVANDAIYGLLYAHQRQNMGREAWTAYRREGAGLDRLVPEWESGMVPNWDEFAKDPEPYRQWWKNWWETKGKALYGSSAQESAEPGGP